jgi:hypothetical protein
LMPVRMLKIAVLWAAVVIRDRSEFHGTARPA